MTRPQTTDVRISSVSEQPVKGGYTRFTILAERTDDSPRFDHWISLTTLNPFRASLCAMARDKQVPVTVTHRATGYFDHDLVDVGPCQEPR